MNQRERDDRLVEIQDALAKAPEGSRIYVKTDQGELKYKTLEQCAGTDEIQRDGKGNPIIMSRKPGRPRTPSLDPINPIVAEICRRRQEAVAEDPILSVARTEPENPDVLHQVVLALGQEAAVLGFEREEAERKGERTGNLSSQRIGALRALGDTWLKRKDQVSNRGIDLDSASFQALLKFILETFREALTAAGERPEMVEAVFSRLSKMLDGNWETEAKNRMKNVI